MGIVLNWSSNYPTTVDDTTTNFPTVVDNVHQVMASHVNELAQAVISLQTVVGGFRAAPVEDPFTSLTDGDVLQWNAGAGEWRANAATALGLSLQDAYDAGNTISLTAATPVAITTSGVGQAGVTVADGVETTTIQGGLLRTGAGTVSAPSISFTSETDGGLYVPIADTVGFAASGVEVARVTAPLGANPQIQANQGTFGYPSYSFTGAYNQHGMFVDTGGKVSISIYGTPTVAFALNTGEGQILMPTNGTAANPSYAWGGTALDTGMYLTTPAGVETVNFSTGGANRVSIDAAAVTPTVSVVMSTASTQFVGAPSDSASVPAFTFSGATAMGMYRNTGIAWSISSSRKMELLGSYLDVQVPVYVPDGSAATPSYTFFSASSTGMYLATGEIQWSIAGAAELALSAAALYPTASLDLGKSTAAWGNAYFTRVRADIDGSAGSTAYGWDADVDLGLYRVAANTLGFSTGGGAASVTMYPRTPADASGQVVFVGAAYDATAQTQVGDGWTAFQFNVSNAGTGGGTKYLEDLQVGGVSQWTVDSTGTLINGTVPSAGLGWPLLAPDGTTGAPSYSFSGDTDAGMYRDSTYLWLQYATGGNGVRLAASGAFGPESADQQLGFSTQSWGVGYINFLRPDSDDSATTPAYAWQTDTNSGMYNAGADVVGISAGATNIAKFSLTGGTVPEVIIPNGSKQTFYNTADETTNYERVQAYWSSNQLLIESQYGGTGVPRDIVLQTVDYAGSTASTAGGSLYMTASNVTTSGLGVAAVGGQIFLTSGGGSPASGAGTAGAAGGYISLLGGPGGYFSGADDGGEGGGVQIQGGLAGGGTTGIGGTVYIEGGAGRFGVLEVPTNVNHGGPVFIYGGPTGGAFNAGDVFVRGGSNVGTGDGGSVYINGGSSTSGTVGTVYIGNDGNTTGVEFSTEALLAAGTAAAPSLSFVAEQDKGMYSPAADTLGFSVNGTLAAQLLYNATPYYQLQFPAGANGVPGLALISDTDTGFGDVNLISGSVTGIAAYVGGSFGGGWLNFGSGVQLYSPAGTAAVPGIGVDSTDLGLYNAGANTLGISTAGASRATVNSTSFTSTVPFYGPAGAVGGPSFAFSNDPDTGMYSYSTNMIGFATAGVARAQITTTQFSSGLPFVGPNGTTTAPTHSFLSDANTGMYSAAADVIGFATGGNSAGVLQRDLTGSSGVAYGLHLTPTINQSGTAGYAGLKITMTNTAAGSGQKYILEMAHGGATRAWVDTNGAWLGGGGNSTTPAFSFTSDADTGMYRSTTDTLGFTTGGTARLTISTTAITSTLATTIPQGSAAAPALNFNAATTTGLYYASSRCGIGVAGAASLEMASSPTSGTTAMYLLYHNGTSAVLQQVTVGAADSGGSGYKLLRVPN